MSARVSVCLAVRQIDRALILCVHIPLVYEHLFYKYFVRLSVGQATKGKSASLLMDVVILVLYLTRIFRLSYFHCSLFGYFLGLITATISSEVTYIYNIFVMLAMLERSIKNLCEIFIISCYL